MADHWMMSRRTLLKGAGVSLALPLLDVMGWANPPERGGGKPPVRMAFIYVPHGVDQANFWPAEGKAAQNALLPKILEPLRPVLSDCLILGGLNHDNAGGDGDAHHARETATWLTGFASKRDVIENAISADQVAAQKIGGFTALPSLELALQEGRAAGDCDKGYSCAYHSHVSWRSPTQPMSRELNPRAVLDRMFSSRKSTQQKRGAGPVIDTKQFASKGVASDDQGPSLDQSMVDLVLGHAKDLRGKVSGNDRRKLDEYLDSVNELEKRIVAIERQQLEAAQAQSDKPQAKAFKTSPLIAVNPPGSAPEKFDEHAKLMLDLIILAFQSDSTRIATLMFSQAFGRSYPECGVPENHHEMSHHGGDAAKLAKVCKINTFHMEQFAYMLTKMKGLQEGKGSLLDNCMILYGSGMGEGNAHDHVNLPTILAGRGGGTITSGRYVKQCKGNLCELLMGMLARAGCPVDAFGDGRKLLPDLS